MQHTLVFKAVGAFTFSLIFALELAPSAAKAETLQEALAYAYQNNPSLQAERAAVRATDENVAQALSGFRPTIAAVGSYTPSRAKTKGNTGNLVYDEMYGDTRTSRVDYGLGLNISQPVFSGFKTVSQTKAAENQVKAAQAGLRLTEENILTQTAAAFADVLQYQSILELKKNNEKVLKQQLEQTRNRFKVGDVTRTDVAQAESRYAASLADRITAEGDLKVANAAYANIVGKYPENLDAPEIPNDFLPNSLDGAVELASRYNPSVIAAEYSARSAWYDVNTQKGDLLPDVSVSASAAKDWNNPLQHYDTTAYQASAKVTIPLYEAGYAYSKVRQAKHTANRYRILKEKAIRDAVNNATSAWESLSAARASISSIRTQIDASARALTGVRREALAGERTVLDVLNAENELLSGQVSLVAAKRNELVASFYLMAAIGRMTASSLGLDVEIYNPEDNYDAVRGQWIGTNVNYDME